jgi:hypothetical protein
MSDGTNTFEFHTFAQSTPAPTASLLFWIVPPLVSAGVLWLLARSWSPVAPNQRLVRVLLAVILMDTCSAALVYAFHPRVSGWTTLEELAAWTLVVMGVLHFSPWRALRAAFACLLLGAFAFFLLAILISLIT